MELQTMIWEEAYYLSNSVPQVIQGHIYGDYPSNQDSRIRAFVQALDEWDSDGELSIPSLGSQSPEEESPIPHSMVFPEAEEDAPTPTMLSVCRSSRRVAFRLGGGFSSILTDLSGTPQLVWCNLSSDIFYFA